MSRNLTGKKVVVVGATGVLGAQISKQLNVMGAQVCAVVRNADHLDLSISEHAIADVTDSTALRNAFSTLAPFDGVINAAGVVAFGMLSELEDKTLTNLFAINAIAPIVMLRESAPHINDDGFFCNISAVVALSPVAGMAAYSASKAGAWAGMAGATRELRRQKIDVIDARPPHTETGLAARPIAGEAPKLPTGLEPAFVASQIIKGIQDGEKDLPVEYFSL
ncbi:MAG: SDR family NAD(P)-dependent oxidoreductase [Candidatus Nanopelagicales bacterium]|nr:SDR family NAD(P)-dependent oxidoreductase [Candidatus Nanopelagicales bacterium]